MHPTVQVAFVTGFFALIVAVMSMRKSNKDEHETSQDEMKKVVAAVERLTHEQANLQIEVQETRAATLETRVSVAEVRDEVRDHAIRLKHLERYV